MTTFAESELKEFGIVMLELEDCAQFIDSSGKLRPRLNQMLDWTSMSKEAKEGVQNFIQLKSVDFAPLCRGLLVTLSGSFEKFVRKLLVSAVVRTNSKIKSFDQLPDGLRIQNLHLSGRAICTVKDPPDHLSIDHLNIVRNLSSCVPGEAGYRLNADVFGMFISNLTPKHLSEVCSSVGVVIDWDYFGGILFFQNHFGLKKTRETANAVAEMLAKTVRLRNLAAHTGAGPTISPEEIRTYVRFFGEFAKAMVGYFEKSLK